MNIKQLSDDQLRQALGDAETLVQQLRQELRSRCEKALPGFSAATSELLNTPSLMKRCECRLRAPERGIGGVCCTCEEGHEGDCEYGNIKWRGTT